MARLGRYFIKDQPQHVIQRGIDRRAVAFHPATLATKRTLLPIWTGLSPAGSRQLPGAPTAYKFPGDQYASAIGLGVHPKSET